MKVLVCGGRLFADRAFIFKFLDRSMPITLLITGAQRKWHYIDGNGQWVGADYFAEEWAKSEQIPYVGVPAEWNKYGDQAGMIRNKLMLNDWKPQAVIAFPGGTGTSNCVREAKKLGIPVTWAAEKVR